MSIALLALAILVVLGIVVELVRKPRHRVGPTFSRSEPPEASEPLEVVRDYVRSAVDGGFVQRDEMREVALEIATDEGLGADPAFVDPMIEAELARHAEAQATWTERTDCDRLDAAFAALGARGVVARQNFTCCQTCGHAEIGEEIAEAKREGPVAGYAFFHQQDTDAAVAGHGIYLSYGATSDRREDAIAVGRTVRDALEEAGLTPQWDGTLAARIAVPMVWRRRRA